MLSHLLLDHFPILFSLNKKCSLEEHILMALLLQQQRYGFFLYSLQESKIIASCAKSLKKAYPSSLLNITTSIYQVLHSSTEEDSHHVYWLDKGEAAQRISIPAILPVPFNLVGLHPLL